MSSAPSRTLEFSLFGDFSREIGDADVIGFDVSRDFAPVLTFEPKGSRAKEDDPSAEFEKSRQSPRPVTVLWQDDETRRRVLIPALRLNVDFAQPLAEGHVLLVGARARRTNEANGEANAGVFNAEGTLVHRWRFGDGIAHVQLGTDGRVWVGYFDEGVFAGEEAIGASGLVAFDPSKGERVFEFNPQDVCEPIDDLYALNVAASETWVYAYSDFALTRLDVSGIQASWKTGVEGSHALAVAGELALLVGTYKDPKQATLLRLSPGEEQASKLGRVKLQIPDDVALDQVRGRGPYLFIRSGALVFRADLRQLSA